MKPPKRILVINNAKIGDLVCTTPVFRAIKEAIPDAYIGVLVTHKTKEIFDHNPRIDKIFAHPLNKKLSLKEILVIAREIRREKFDTVINIIPGLKNFIIPILAGIPNKVSAEMKVMGKYLGLIAKILGYKVFTYKFNTLSVKNHLSLLKLIGIANDNLKKEVFVSEAGGKKAAQFYDNHQMSKNDLIIGLCLTAGNKFKEWGVDNFSELAIRLINDYQAKIILIGGPSDAQILESAKAQIGLPVVTSHSDFNLSEVPSLIKRFDYFISVDTGPLYIANALDVPVVDIVGPCSLYDQPPIYEKCVPALPGGQECHPCTFYGYTMKECLEGKNDCLKRTTVEDVLKAFKELKNKYPKT